MAKECSLKWTKLQNQRVRPKKGFKIVNQNEKTHRSESLFAKNIPV